LNLEALAQELLAPLGFELLELQMNNAQRTMVLVFRIDRLDEQPVSIEDLEMVSKTLSLELDQLDQFKNPYRLETESPGPNRPLSRIRHFERMLGLKAKVRSTVKNFTGVIESIEDPKITFVLETKEVITLELGQFTAELAEFPSSHR
jgi:ribosome maturation factor RimP